MAHESLERIYKPGVGYKKSGLMLGELTNTDEVKQYDMEWGKEKKQNAGQGERLSKEVLEAVDQLNKRYGRYAVTVGAVHQKTSKWQGNRNHASPRYTTRWTDLLKV